MNTIRKLLAVLLAAAMCLTGFALAEEENGVTAHDYIGEWVDQDGTCNIDVIAREEGDGYIVNVHVDVFEGDNFTYLSWVYGCVYDEETCTMKSFSRVSGKGDYEPHSEEEITETDNDYTGAELSFDEAGKLIWSDEGLDVDDAMAFEHTIGWYDPDYIGPGYLFTGRWDSERVSIEIEEHGDFYPVLIAGSNSATESTMWIYNCVYDEETGTLVTENADGIKVNVTTSDDGEETWETVYEDGEASFSLNDDFQLIWEDKKENNGEGRVFEYVPPYNPIAEYEGVWAADRATLIIEELDDIVYCSIHWGSSYKDAAEWEYTDCQYDEITGGLTTFETGVKTIVEYNEDGETVSSVVEYDNGAASFVINDEGELVWTDFKETPGENEVVFTRVEMDDLMPSAEELADGYFRVIGGVEQGTAGASLKLAQAVTDVTTFATDYALWDPAIETLRANMLEAWESLSDEERAAFDGNFINVVELIDSCLEDWESNAGVFEDAGVTEQMEMFVFDPLSRLAWENLCAHTLTLGNG